MLFRYFILVLVALALSLVFGFLIEKFHFLPPLGMFVLVFLIFPSISLYRFLRRLDPATLLSTLLSLVKTNPHAVRAFVLAAAGSLYYAFYASIVSPFMTLLIASIVFLLIFLASYLVMNDEPL